MFSIKAKDLEEYHQMLIWYKVNIYRNLIKAKMNSKSQNPLLVGIVRALIVK